MLIKIDKDRYINSDHIIAMTPITATTPGVLEAIPTGNVRLIMTDSTRLEIPSTIADYIAQTLDAHDAFTTEQPQEMSLQSRLAIHLRNQSAGQSLNMLASVFTDTDKYSIEAALNELDANNVVHALGVDEDRLFYHASNAIFSGPPEAF